MWRALNASSRRKEEKKTNPQHLFFPQCRNGEVLRQTCLAKTQDDAVTSSFQEIRNCATNSICRGFYRSHRDIKDQHVQYHTDFSCTHNTPGQAQRHLTHAPTLSNSVTSPVTALLQIRRNGFFGPRHKSGKLRGTMAWAFYTSWCIEVSSRRNGGNESKERNNKSGVEVMGDMGWTDALNSRLQLLHIARLQLCMAGSSLSVLGVSRSHLQVTMRHFCLTYAGMTKQDVFSRFPLSTGENESPFYF